MGTNVFPKAPPTEGLIDKNLYKEFEELKKEVLELKKLIKQAAEFDKKTGQPDCHSEDKVKLLRDLAKHLGIEIEDVIKKMT